MMARVLSRRGAMALVRARLAALGHGKEFMTQEAFEALRARAGRDSGTLGAALGAVLFVASTEDAPRIEGRHVDLAVPSTQVPGPPASGFSQARRVIAASIAGALVGALAVVWVALPSHSHMTPLPPVLPKPRPSIAAKAPAPPLLEALPARQLRPAHPPVALPEAPPERVSLLVPAGDRDTASRFAALAARLREGGIGDVHMQSFNSAKIETRPLRHHVVYYFRQDRQLAENLAATLDSAEDPSHIRASWVPILVPGAAGSTLHPPGSVDVFAP